MVPFLALALISALPFPSPGLQEHAPFLRNDARGTATVTIITPARVGEGLGPPRPGMTPRIAMLSVAGGVDRLLLIYDFE